MNSFDEFTGQVINSFDDFFSKVHETYTPMPSFQLLLDTNGELKDITLNFEPRLISLEISEDRGGQADQLHIELSDHDGLLEMPEKGTKVHCSLSADKNKPFIFKGTFKVDEIQHQGPPDKLSIRARAVDISNQLKIKHDKSWHEIGLTDILNSLAQKHNLKARIDEQFNKIHIKHIDQVNESDISFLTRLGDENDAVATVKNDYLIFLPINNTTTSDGNLLPLIEITRKSGDQHNFESADRGYYSGVKAIYHSNDKAKQYEVIYQMDGTIVGADKKTVASKNKNKKKSTNPKFTYVHREVTETDDSIKVLNTTYSGLQAAQKAADAEVKRIQREAHKFSITLSRGRPEITPQCPVKVFGFKRFIDQQAWQVVKVSHKLSTSSGLTTQLQLETNYDQSEKAKRENDKEHNKN